MKLLIASFASFLHIQKTTGIRLPFPIEIPDGHTEITVHGKLVDWLRSNGVSEYNNGTQTSEDLALRGGGISLMIPFLTKYGCWCYRGSDYPAGKGSPRDSFDEACKRHHMGFDCIIDDAPNEDSNCVIDGNGDYSVVKNIKIDRQGKFKKATISTCLFYPY